MKSSLRCLPDYRDAELDCGVRSSRDLIDANLEVMPFTANQFLAEGSLIATEVRRMDESGVAGVTDLFRLR